MSPVNDSPMPMHSFGCSVLKLHIPLLKRQSDAARLSSWLIVSFSRQLRPMATAGSPAAQQAAKSTESRGRKTSVIFNARASAAGAGMQRKSEGSGEITNAVAIT